MDSRSLAAWDTLIDRAAHRRTITYGELGAEFGVAPRAVGWIILGSIQAYCHDNNLPILTAIVVKSSNGRPGSGLRVRVDDVAAEQQRVFAHNWSETMSTEESPVDRYLAARQARSDKAEEVERAIAPIIRGASPRIASLMSNGRWRRLLLSNFLESAPVPAELAAAPSIDASTWPDGANIALLISEWHVANFKVTITWLSVPGPSCSGLHPPSHGRAHPTAQPRRCE